MRRGRLAEVAALGTLLLSPVFLASAALPGILTAQESVGGRGSTEDGRPLADADTLAAPVDSHPARRILETGQVELAAALNELAPSTYFPRRQGADLTSGVRPFQLRGLSPDHAVVLVNGKRRHATAVVHTSGGGAFPGSSGVDLNAFPLQAIGRMEILRDGGAARRGSDAIAGVINLRLRNTVSKPEFIASLGRRYPDEWGADGTRYDLSANWGIGVGRRGVLNVTGAFSQRDPTNRAGADPRDQIVPGDADFVDGGTVIRKNHDVEQPNHLWGDGESTNRTIFANLELPSGDAPDATQLYAFGGYSQRREQHPGLYVRSMDDRNWLPIHPLGFLPFLDADTRDLFGVAGLRGGDEGGWQWDASAQYGANRVDIDTFDTLNPSLGPCLETPCAPGADGIPGTRDDPELPNRTRFQAGSLENGQFQANADLRRRLDLGLGGGDATLGLGVSFRRDYYRVGAGEPDSYGNGFHPTQSGGVAVSGSPPFPGFRPAEAGHWGRSTLGIHWEAEAPLRPDLLASAAARYEHYSDVGGALSGHLAVRFQASDDVIFRTAASTGFRAPSLGQSHYGHVAAGLREDPDDPDTPIPFEVGEFPIRAPAAAAVGAVPLTMEKARSLSAGFALTPADNVHVTIDGYATDVDDAIVLSNSLSSVSSHRVERLLADFAVESIRFFLNAIDLRSYGVDATVNWRRTVWNASWLQLGAAANWSQVRGLCPDDDISACVEENPVLGDATSRTYDAFDVYDLEEGRPDWRGAFNAALTTGAFRFGLGANVYGSHEELRQFRGVDDPPVVRRFEPKATLDADITWGIGAGWRLTVGGENLLDAFPTRVDALGGILPYRSTSALGFNGRYLYTRLQASVF
ncbi:TonB-dependent receptor plug domain-containing protein [Candidatus Palauibacter sp.]|uniref:TonB-dependent receptor plug domain-containing protein n=1 Tax=Candidatus Palauibacter sp. TaxID=3101350 RepID=UPI003B014891